ncbi:hypothetical protein [Pacificispira sp.]|uniref:hypothetical protein n=1 Tax=Pacificispira sp. TaxID=2888761 RepID=UPI003BA947B3
MPPRLAFLHTAAVHEPTFRALVTELSPGADQVHAIHPEWLDQARREGLGGDLHDTVTGGLSALADQSDAVLCTCSTLGPVADDLAKTNPKVLRIDRPLMAKAAATPGSAIVALCLDSTRDATLSLIDDAFAAAGRRSDRTLCLCAEAWPYFERGDRDGFARSIAAQIRRTAGEIPGAGCVVLAQASMACAEPLLTDLGLPVFSSPRLGVEAALVAAGQ